MPDEPLTPISECSLSGEQVLHTFLLLIHCIQTCTGIDRSLSSSAFKMGHCFQLLDFRLILESGPGTWILASGVVLRAVGTL